MSPDGSPPKIPFSTVLEHQDPVHPADDEKTVGGGPPAQGWRGKSCSVHYRKTQGPPDLRAPTCREIWQNRMRSPTRCLKEPV